jgi:hypothetical protein
MGRYRLGHGCHPERPSTLQVDRKLPFRIRTALKKGCGLTMEDLERISLEILHSDGCQRK